MMYRILGLTMFCMVLTTTSVSRADYIWTGAGDGISTYQEANWEDTNTNLAPPAGSMDPNVTVGADLVVNSGTPGGPSGAGAHLILGPRSLSITDGTFRMGGGAGIRGGTIDISSGSLLAQFFANSVQAGHAFPTGTQVTLGGDASITLYGGGNPVNNGATIDFTSDTSELKFLAETPAAFLSEHLSKISVNGSPAINGVNLNVVADGSGSIVTAVIVPPPTPQTLTWTGGGDGTSFDDVNNWDSTPGAGTIDLSNLLDNFIIDDASATVNMNNGGARMDFSSLGGSITLEDGTLNVNSNGGVGISQTSGGSSSITVNGGQLSSQWIEGIEVEVGGDGVIELVGGGSPLPNGTTVDMTSPNARVNFLNETPGAFTTEHLGIFSVNGSSGVEGANLFVNPFNGALGSQISAVPEPSSICLLAMASVVLLVGFKRKKIKS